eukprot:GILI01011072.1.p1 GENE.GILI01011072.1~~GILI01011072.1.p1  ORF type:complete len:432 (-),score=51.69 GILI01011072.1:43-1272(-)
MFWKRAGERGMARQRFGYSDDDRPMSVHQTIQSLSPTNTAEDGSKTLFLKMGAGECLSRTPRTRSFIPNASDTVAELNKQSTFLKTKGEYMRAQDIVRTLSSLKDQDALTKRHMEESRQHDERKALNEAFSVRFQRLKDEWKQREDEMHADFQRRRENLAEEHQTQQLLLEKEIRRFYRIYSKPKFSKNISEKLTQMNNLVKSNQFEDAQVVKQRMYDEQLDELVKYAESLDSRAQAKREQLKQTQETQIEELDKKVRFAVTMFKKKRKIAFDAFFQSCRNHDQDMSHAHRLEFCSAVPPDCVLSSSRRSHADKSSTFRGTHLKSQLNGGTLYSTIPLSQTVEVEYEPRSASNDPFDMSQRFDEVMGSANSSPTSAHNFTPRPPLSSRGELGGRSSRFIQDARQALSSA